MSLVKFDLKYLTTDVTAVKFLENYIIAGIGNYIHVFDIQPTKLILKKKVFEEKRVHHIFLRQNHNIAVTGENVVHIYNIENQGQLKISKQLTLTSNDWIQYVHWLDCGNIVLITAHNVISLWNSKTADTIKTIFCEENCIIYSAFLSGTTWNELLVIVGTVFQQILVWSPADIENETIDSPVLHKLEGHEGAVFSVSYDDTSQIICSTSDDRSVRLWSVQFQQSNTNNHWKEAKILPLHVMYGHSSRVWKNIIIDNKIVSVGEDSMLCIWNTDGSLEKSLKTHQNGNVWSVDCNKDKNLIVTGGGDGGICLWPLYNDVPVTISITFPEDLFKQDSLLVKESTCILPRRIRLISKGNVVAITDNGCLLYFTASNYCQGEWTVIFQDDKFLNYCLLEVSPCKKYIALGNINGYVCIFSETHSTVKPLELKFEIEVQEGRIFSLIWLSSEVILTCGPNGIFSIWNFVYSLPNLIHLCQFELPKCKERWITACTLKDKFLVCGDRMGNVHLFSLDGNQDKKIKKPIQTFQKIHSHLGVTSFIWHENYLYSTGRDGTLRKYILMENECSLQHLHADKMGMEWPASVVVSHFGMLILGFKAVNFLLRSHPEGYTILQVPCGGGHRSWDWILENDDITFIYLKDKSVYLHKWNLDNIIKPVIQKGFHTKQITCSKSVISYMSEDENNHIFITGGEDTTIRVLSTDSSNNLYTLTVLQRHISNVHALAICPFHENFLVFTGGGRAQMKVWQFSISKVEGCLPKVVCKELFSHMLRDPKKSGKKPWLMLEQTVDPETQYMDLSTMTFQDQKMASDTKEIIILIAAGCSDGFFRLFGFHTLINELFLIGKFYFHNYCILKVSFIQTKSFKYVALTMATDGNMAFWDVSICSEHFVSYLRNEYDSTNEASASYSCNHLEVDVKLTPFSYFKVHQSGINSFDWLHLKDDLVLLATGGDDNTMVLSAVHILCVTQKEKQVEIVLQWRNEYAHTSQITGLKFRDNLLISTGIDQRLKIWKWNCDIENCKLTASLVGQYFTTVSDIQGLFTWDDRSSFAACVHGKGLEILNIQPNEDI